MNVQDENSQSNKKNGLILPLVLIGVLLAGSIGYNLYQANKLTNYENNESLNSQILKNELNQKDLIRKQYDSILNDYNQYKARIEDRNNLLGGQENIIQLKNKDIQGILDKQNPTAEEMNRARKMIADLEGSVKNYKSEVSRLQKENAILVRSVEELNSKNALLDENNRELTHNYEVEKEGRAKDNADNQSKINDLSSTLSISNQQIAGIRVRKSGKEVEKNRARRVDKINVSFDVDRNSRTESGSKKLYVSIYNPNGTLGKYKNSKGGKIELRSGEFINYSDEITFNYTNGQSKKIEFDWEHEEFQKGVYTFNVYENGFKISQAKITLN